MPIKINLIIPKVPLGTLHYHGRQITMINMVTIVCSLVISTMLSIPVLTAQASQFSLDKRAKDQQLIFEGTVLKIGPQTPASGVFAFYRLAKYRVDRVFTGSYSASEIVVDHLALTTRELEGIKENDHVCIKVTTKPKLFSTTYVNGIREQGTAISQFHQGEQVSVGNCGDRSRT